MGTYPGGVVPGPVQFFLTTGEGETLARSGMAFSGAAIRFPALFPLREGRRDPGQENVAGLQTYDRRRTASFSGTEFFVFLPGLIRPARKADEDAVPGSSGRNGQVKKIFRKHPSDHGKISDQGTTFFKYRNSWSDPRVFS
jgi:hypothetical protein